MGNRIRDVVRMQSLMLVILGMSMIVPCIIAIASGENSSITAFAATMTTCLLLGLAGQFCVKPSEDKLRFRDGFLVVSLAWLISSVVGAAPFIISGAIPSPVDALFEAASGFTTTGATILAEIESLPRSILFWRCFTHWLGGMGIIVIVMALLPMFGISGQIAANAETPGPTKDKVTAKFTDTAKGLYLIYTGFTVTQILLLMLGGVSLYDAALHSFSTMGTGGFSNYNNSIAHFTSPYLQIVIIVFMTIAGMNFNLYYLSKKRGLMSIFKDEEARFYLTVIGVSSALIFAFNAFSTDFVKWGTTLLGSVFQVVSVITTTGFITENYDLWPVVSKMLLFSLFFIGGSSSSTGGGVKCVRVLVVLKILKRGFSLKIHPNRVAPLTLNDVEVSNTVVIKIINFVFLYIAVLFAGSFLVSFDNMDFMSTISSVATCLGNIGPGFNVVGPVNNFSTLSWFSKLVLSFMMIAGRLELFTIFTLFSINYWKPNRTR